MAFGRRVRRLITGSAPRPLVGPSWADVQAVRRALAAESRRRDRREGLSLSVFMEFTDLPLRGIDLYKILAHLEAEGELANVVQSSDGNLRFDVTDRLFAHLR